MDAYTARERLDDLAAELRMIVKRDPDQDVRGAALPVLDAAVTAGKDALDADDPIVAAIRDVISPEAIETGESVLASDALLVVTQLAAALPVRPMRRRGLGYGEPFD